jgi:hypothetical protein
MIEKVLLLGGVCYFCQIVKNSTLSFFYFSFFILCAPTAFGQITEVRGRVIEGKTKEPLSYANVRMKGTITGTTTDDGGFYFIRTPEKVDSIVFSYLGYPTRVVKIQRGKSQELNIELGSEGIAFNQVIVKAGKRKKVYRHYRQFCVCASAGS